MFNLITRPALLGDNWNVILPMLGRIKEREHDLYGFDDEQLVRDILSFRRFLLVETDGNDTISACAVVEFLSYPKKKALRILYAAGKKSEDWPEHIEKIELLAKHYSIDYIEIWGRKGWEKMLKPLGYGVNVVNYLKELK